MKKLLSVILAAAMILSLAACGAQPAANNQSSDTKPATEESKAEDTAAEEVATDPSEWPTVVMEVISFTDTQEKEQVVEDALNDYLVSINAGVKADLLPIAIGDRGNQITLLLTQPGELDLFCWRFYSTVDSLVKNEQVLSLEPYKDVYPELWELYPESVYKTCTINGELYSLPGADSFGNFNAYVMRKDVAEAIGAMDKVNTKITMDELNDMFLKARELYPELCCHTTLDDAFSLMGVDNLGNPDCIGGLLNRGVGQTEIINFYETEEFKDFCMNAKFWADNGMIIADPLQVEKPAIDDNMTIGGLVDGYSIPYIQSLMDAQIHNYEVVLFQTNDFVGTNSCVYNGWNISANCPNPDAAMKLLYLLATDEKAARFVSMGVEGVTYEVHDNGCAYYVEGCDANNNGWNVNAPWWYPNECLTIPFDTDMATYFTDMEACWTDPNNQYSAAMGFNFDNTEVFDKQAACASVVKEYRAALLYGQQADVEGTIDKFNEELHAAGLDDVLDEMNRQFKEFLGE